MAVLMSVVMVLGVAVGTASANHPPPNDCGYKLSDVSRVSARDSGTQMYAMARASRPIKPERKTSATVWIEVWQPNRTKAGGTWRRISIQDYDLSNQVAIGFVSRGILFGPNTYRSAARFACDVGDKVYVVHKHGRSINLNRINIPWGGYGGGGRWGKNDPRFGGHGGGGGWPV